MKSERITFKNQFDEELVGDFYLPEGSVDSGVVFGHCFTCSRHTRILTESCEKLSENGIAALRFDFSGNGQSDGEFANTTYSKHVKEMALAVDWMKEKGIQNFGLAGHSMGAAISLLTATVLPEINAVSTLAGRYSELNIHGFLDQNKKEELKKEGQVSFTSRNRSLILKSDFFNDISNYDLTSSVKELDIPVLAFHGDKDEIIPVGEVHKSKEIKPDNTEVFVIEGADHMFSHVEHRSMITEKMVNWFKTNLQFPN